MSDEIKEIFIRMNDLIKHQFDKEYHTKCDLFKDIQGLLDYITNLQLEIDRLNNIINELEKSWKEQQEYYRYRKDNRYRSFLSKNLDKLKELKENKWNKNYSINTQK